jgi:streptomycin 3"-adenylyltransferase
VDLPDAPREQLDEASTAIVRALRAETVVGLYLYGSAVAGGLRPQSDLDLFGVVRRTLSGGERQRLADALLTISERSASPDGRRPLEVTLAVESDVRPWRFPARREFLYGEWLRDDFAAGRMGPASVMSADLGVVIHMVRLSGRALLGPPASELLDLGPPDDLVRAMVHEIPSLMAELETDTRNVLLTLARIWHTSATGEIAPKDEAADRVLAQLSASDRPLITHARDLYRSGGYGAWDLEAARRVADRIAQSIRAGVRSG